MSTGRSNFSSSSAGSRGSITYGQDWLFYIENGRRMSIKIETGVGDITIWTATIGRWDDAIATRVNSFERERITQQIVQQLSDRGHRVYLSAQEDWSPPQGNS